MNEQKNALWKGASASIPGFGHIRKDIPCQDASLSITTNRPAIIVCDGRGSAAHSHFGSQAAVKMFRTQIAVLEPMLASILDRENAEHVDWHNLCRLMCRALVQVKLELAEERGLPEKEFDFTVAFAITGKKFIGCFQVGDGAIVMRQNGICETAFQPDKGEFANQTSFLRSGCDVSGKFQARLFDASINNGIAITSDGPEHLMFKLPEMIPGKVFDAMFDDLIYDELSRQDILNYLTDRRWNNDPRGSDDRSLAIIVPVKTDTAPIDDDKPESDDAQADTVENIDPCVEEEPETSMPEADDAQADTVENIDPCVEEPETSTLEPSVEDGKTSAIGSLQSIVSASVMAILISAGAFFYVEAEQAYAERVHLDRQIDFLHKCLRSQGEKYRMMRLENQKLRNYLAKYNSERDRL